jgi:hypothetical protein
LELFAGEEDEGEDGGGGGGGKEGGSKAWQRKPAEHRGLFGGNTDDHFRCAPFVAPVFSSQGPLPLRGAPGMR